MNIKRTAVILSILTAISTIFTPAGAVLASETAGAEAAADAEEGTEPEAAPGGPETELSTAQDADSPDSLTDQEYYSQLNQFAGRFAACASEDEETFRTLYTEDSLESFIDSDYQALQSYNMSSLDRKNFLTIEEKEDISIVNLVYYSVQYGKSGNTLGCILPMTRVDGEWKIDYSQNALNYVAGILSKESLYPAGYTEAYKAGRNTVMFDNHNLLYLNQNMVYSGCSDYSVKFAWQEEGGGLMVYLWLVNGTSQEVHYTDAQLKLTDDELGEILSCTASVDETLPAGTSELVSLPIPADSETFKTGTKTWSSVNYQLIVNSETAGGEENVTEGTTETGSGEAAETKPGTDQETNQATEQETAAE